MYVDPNTVLEIWITGIETERTKVLLQFVVVFVVFAFVFQMEGIRNRASRKP